MQVRSDCPGFESNLTTHPYGLGKMISSFGAMSFHLEKNPIFSNLSSGASCEDLLCLARSRDPIGDTLFQACW